LLPKTRGKEKMKIEEGMKRLEEGVKKILEKNEVKDLLKMAIVFHKYSFNNMILIFAQRPGAKRVAGMTTWNRLGRWVKKGEKGIAILAPVIAKVKKRQKDDDETEEYSEETVYRRLAGFTVRYVYDIEQTQGKELPTADALECDSAGIHIADGGLSAAELYEKIMAASPVPVRTETMFDGSKGYYSITNKEIVLADNLTENEKPMVLLHELAHHFAINAQLHVNRACPEAEVIAEAAAFIAGSYFALDTSAYSFPYVVGWGKDINKILAWGKAATVVARQILDAINEGSGEINVPLAA